MEFNVTEADRIAALVSYGILDTDFEEPFDRVTRSVSSIFGVPIAAVSLVDVNRQWFKSMIGLDVRETPRRVAFCEHTMRKPKQSVFVVEDPTTHELFAENELVTGEPGIRFYAGSPLISKGGIPLGALCIIDVRPRPDLCQQSLHPLAVYAQRCIWLLERRRMRRLEVQAKGVAEPRRDSYAEEPENNPWINPHPRGSFA